MKNILKFSLISLGFICFTTHARVEVASIPEEGVSNITLVYVIKDKVPNIFRVNMDRHPTYFLADVDASLMDNMQFYIYYRGKEKHWCRPKAQWVRLKSSDFSISYSDLTTARDPFICSGK